MKLTSGLKSFIYLIISKLFQKIYSVDFQSINSFSWNHRQISLVAASHEWAPWTKSFSRSVLKSPRIVPGSASSGLEFPIIRWLNSMISEPSHTIGTTGPVDKCCSSLCFLVGWKFESIPLKIMKKMHHSTNDVQSLTQTNFIAISLNPFDSKRSIILPIRLRWIDSGLSRIKVRSVHLEVWLAVQINA